MRAPHLCPRACRKAGQVMAEKREGKNQRWALA